MSDPATKAAPSTGALAALDAKFATKMSDGGAPKKITRRAGTVTVPLTVCEPDTFDEDPVITLEGLSAQAEFEAMKVASDGASAGFAMAKLSMKELNGTIMKSRQRDLVWECLGFGGRAIVVNGYLTQCTGAGAADLGKSLGITTEE